MATKAKKASARKKTARSTRGTKRSASTKSRKTTMRAGSRKSTTMRAGTRKTGSSSNGRKSAAARVKRVTREVVQQATVAVAAGVETLKDLGEQLVDRVRA